MFFSLISGIFAFCILILFIIFGNSYIPETKNALFLFLNTIFPTMFPFYVLSSIIVSNKSISVLTRPLKGVTKFYNLPTETSVAIIIGFLCGFPVGAKVTCDLLKNNYITPKEAAVLAAFTNNASPIFLISIVGRNYLKSEFHGFVIWLCIIFSSLLSGLILSKIALCKSNSYERKNVNDKFCESNLTDSIVSGLNTALYVGSVIIFFSSITALIKKISFLSNKMYIGIYSFLEMTGGLNALFNLSISKPNIYRFIAVILIVSWSGICVHMQVCGILKSNGIKTKYYFIEKLLQTIFAIILFTIIYIFLR